MHLGIANDLLEDGERGGELAIPALGSNAPHNRVSSLEHAVSHRFRSIRPQSGHDPLRRAHPALGQPQVLDLLVEVHHGVSSIRGLEGDPMQFALHAFRGAAEFGRALYQYNTVVKNTLTKIAAREAGVTGLDDLLAGPSAIAFVKGDPVDAAKGIRNFAKENPNLVIKGGVMDGVVLAAADIQKLADLESREVLLAKLAGAMKSKQSQAAALFASPPCPATKVIPGYRPMENG